MKRYMKIHSDLKCTPTLPSSFTLISNLISSAVKLGGGHGARTATGSQLRLPGEEATSTTHCLWGLHGPSGDIPKPVSDPGRVQVGDWSRAARSDASCCSHPWGQTERPVPAKIRLEALNNGNAAR